MKRLLTGLFCLGFAALCCAKERMTIAENCLNTQPEGKNWDCVEAAKDWLPPYDPDKDDYVAPLIIAPRGNIQHKQVLILSPTESSAYDIATRQIVASLDARRSH